MSTGDGHSAPETTFIDAIAEAVVARLPQHEPRPELDSAISQLLSESGFEPLRVYSAKEVARLLGTKRVASVYEISENELPRVRRTGTAIGFHGINVLAYMLGREPVDVDAIFDRHYRRLMDDRPSNTYALRPEQQERVRVR